MSDIGVATATVAPETPVTNRRRGRKRAAPVAAVVAVEVKDDQHVEADLPPVAQPLDLSLDDSDNHSPVPARDAVPEIDALQALMVQRKRAKRPTRQTKYQPKDIKYLATSNDVPNYSGTVGLPADAKYLLERLPTVIWRHSILPFLSIQTIFQHMTPINKYFYHFSQPLLHRSVDSLFPGLTQVKAAFALKSNGRKVINAKKLSYLEEEEESDSKAPSVPLAPREVAWLLEQAESERTAHERRHGYDLDLTRPTISKTMANSKYCVTINQLNIQRTHEETQSFRNHRYRLTTIVKLMFERFGSVESMLAYKDNKDSRPRRRMSRMPFGFMNMLNYRGGGFGLHGPGCTCGMGDLGDEDSDMEDGLFGMLFRSRIGYPEDSDMNMSDYDSEM